MKRNLWYDLQICYVVRRPVVAPHVGWRHWKELLSTLESWRTRVMDPLNLRWRHLPASTEVHSLGCVQYVPVRVQDVCCDQNPLCGGWFLSVFQLRRTQQLILVVLVCAPRYPPLWGRKWFIISLTMQHCWGKSGDQLVILMNGTKLLCYVYIPYCVDTCSKLEARHAFASYLERVQNRLLKNTRYNSCISIQD